MTKILDLTISASLGFIAAILVGAVLYMAVARSEPATTAKRECVTRCYPDRTGKGTICQRICRPTGTLWQTTQGGSVEPKRSPTT